MRTDVLTEKKGTASKAVSATLAGVLAVGMVPAAALAQTGEEIEGDASLETLAVSQDKAFSAGTIALKDDSSNPVYTAATNTSGATIANSFTAAAPDEALKPVVATVTPSNGGTIDIIDADGKVKSDYTVKYVTATSDGKPSTTEVTSLKDPGTYFVVVTATSGTYKGGEVSAKITIQGASFDANTTLVADGAIVTAGQSSHVPEVTYCGEAISVDFGYTDSTTNEVVTYKAGTDYTVKYFKDGEDQNKAGAGSTTAPTDKGTYFAVLTGLGKYADQEKSIEFQITSLVVSADNVYVEQVVGDKTAMPTQPTTVAGSADLASQVTLTYTGSVNAPGVYEATLGLANSKDTTGNITFNGTINVVKVSEEATITYDDEALPEELNINLADDDDAFDADKIAVKAGKTTLEAGTASEDDGVSNLATANYTVTYEKVTSTGTTTAQASELANAGTYIVTITVNPDSAYKVGGSAQMTVKVIEDSLDGDASLYVKFGNDIVTSVETVYGNGDDTLTVTLKDSDDADVEDLTLTLTDADGEETEFTNEDDLADLNAGEYTLTVTADGYEITNNTVAITIKPYDVTSIKLDENIVSGVENTAQLGVPAGTDLDTVLAAVQFNENGDKNDANGELVYKSFSGINDEIYEIAITKDGEEVEDLDEVGTYTITVSSTDEDGNYVVSAEPITFEVIKALDFADVPTTAWYYDYVSDAKALGYMTGDTGSVFFRPGYNMTRAEATAVIYKLAGGYGSDINTGSYSSEYGTKTGFTDVSDTSWEASYVSWAARNGIVKGYGDGTFHPSDNVTREEFAIMLVNYAKALNKYTAVENADTILAQYIGGNEVSSWAKDAVAWCVSQGLMGGDTVNGLRPTSQIIRAEAAKIVTVFQPVNMAGQTAKSAKEAAQPEETPAGDDATTDTDASTSDDTATEETTDSGQVQN